MTDEKYEQLTDAMWLAEKLAIHFFKALDDFEVWETHGEHPLMASVIANIKAKTKENSEYCITMTPFFFQSLMLATSEMVAENNRHLLDIIEGLSCEKHGR